jgi:surfeit locus 1 family protein
MIPRIISSRPLISLITALALGVCVFFIVTKEGQIQTDQANAIKFKERNNQVPLSQLPFPIDYSVQATENLLYRKVNLEGSFLPDHVIYLENRVAETIPKPNTKKISGFHIIMPFLLDSGKIVWVNRGWIKRDPINRQNIPDVQSIPGKQILQGYISVGKKNIFEMPDEKPHIINGHVVALNFYLHDDKKDLPNRNVYPFIIIQTSENADGLARPEADFYYAPDYSFDLRTWWFTLMIAIGFWFISGITLLWSKPKS